ncbi:hypothetical protein CKO_03659 [Citrobacter koseri ATCC BAA-895]|uniref:Uncharacterized protein n=1 Tax=Citrobacter koseri (strain ATCC BAA-895 / CDC 4225-83 / SGSC4696) TaxID=290338 RepID=A8AMM5_CITK8|nr:hypothetical protein CKO_03659 [Citrobacter koseri ATCC BAA-895]
MDEFNYLAGACPRFGAGRFRPDAVSPRLEENDLCHDATAGKCFTSFWRRSCGCRSCCLLHVEENDWLIKK